MKRIFLGFIFWQLTFYLYAQDRCGHVEYMNELYKQYPNLLHQQDSLNKSIKQRIQKSKLLKTAKIAAEATYQIPVVVHVIYNNLAGGITNISDEQIYSQIAVLNQDYSRSNADTNLTFDIYKGVAANVNIQFCLATLDPNGEATNGINRIYNAKSSFELYELQTLKGYSYWPSDQYLNLWVCNIASPYLGIAQFPAYTSLPGLNDTDGPATTDGVVIDYAYFGNTGAAKYPYNMGRTASHEVGHWLGLIHIWGDADCGDDYVNDTPTQQYSHAQVNCDTTYSSCLGPVTIDMFQNYMDYSIDQCMNLFTQGQKDRMRSVMNISPSRMSLLESFGCCPETFTTRLPYVTDFEDDNYLTNQWQILNFDASSPYSKKWQEVSSGAYGESNTSLMIDNDSVYTSTDSTYWDVLESPVVDLTVSREPMLDFDLAYANNTFSNSTDSLVIYYNTGCKDKWVAIKTIYGNDLVTTSRKVDNFVPEISEWKKVMVSLLALKGKKRVRFRIAVFSKGINSLYIDNINFYQSGIPFVVNAFPVPAENELNVEVIYPGYRDVTIELYNVLGKLILSREIKNSTSFVESLNISNLLPGFYDVRVVSGKVLMSKKIAIH